MNEMSFWISFYNKANIPQKHRSHLFISIIGRIENEIQSVFGGESLWNEM